MPASAFRRLASLAAVFAAALPAGPAAAQEPRIEPVTVRAVAHFAFGQAALAPADAAALLAEVGRLTDVHWQSVETAGHTDSVGPATVNERLGQQRADAVKRYLVGQGLDAAMIATRGEASASPVASNDTAEGRAANRRAEVEFRGVRTRAAR